MKGQGGDGRAESTRRRIANELRSRGEDPSVGLQRYAVERFLYRLGRSNHRERFVLKGATLFAIWGTAYRPTRDIDFAGYGSSNAQDVIDAVREICNTADDVDQIAFDTDTITAEPIRDQSEYDGLRIRIRMRLGNSHIPLQVDVGFGNAIVPGPEEREYRTILGDPPPRILVYPPESVVAEKLHATVILGERNSRYKDFYDLYMIAGAFPFERSTLAEAVRATFDRRATQVDAALPVALAAPFYSDGGRAAQWRTYVNRNRLVDAQADFIQVGDRLIAFLQPIWAGLRSGAAPEGNWPPGGPWG
jgi:hypothetical protein